MHLGRRKIEKQESTQAGPHLWPFRGILSRGRFLEQTKGTIAGSSPVLRGRGESLLGVCFHHMEGAHFLPQVHLNRVGSSLLKLSCVLVAKYSY